MGIRRQFIGFTGAVQILLTLVMFSLGSTISDLAIAQSLLSDENDESVALGVPLWGGVVILMCGAGNIVEAFTARSSRKRSNDLLPCSIGAFCANLLAFLASGIIIGIFAWAIYDVASTYVVMVSTVLASASIIFILSMLAMFVDCMTVCLSSSPSQPRPYFVEYDAPPPARGGTLHGYKA